MISLQGHSAGSNGHNKAARWTGSVASVTFSGLAAFIGLCCIGPVTVTLFGVSGAVLLARLEPIRPWVLAIAGICAAYSFWQLYIGPRVSANARNRPVSASQHAFFWVSILLIVFAIYADAFVALW